MTKGKKQKSLGISDPRGVLRDELNEFRKQLKRENPEWLTQEQLWSLDSSKGITAAAKILIMNRRRIFE